MAVKFHWRRWRKGGRSTLGNAPRACPNQISVAKGAESRRKASSARAGLDLRWASLACEYRRPPRGGGQAMAL